MIKYKGTTLFPPALYDILDNIGMVDIALLTLAREKLLQSSEGFADLSAYQRYFGLIQQHIPELYAVRITDAAGVIIAASDGAGTGWVQNGRSLAEIFLWVALFLALLEWWFSNRVLRTQAGATEKLKVDLAGKVVTS